MSTARSRRLFHAIAIAALRDIAPALDEASLRSALSRIEEAPDLRRGGVEIHLESGRADLQLCVSPGTEDWFDLQRWVATTSAESWCRSQDALRTLRALTTSDSPPNEIWLEADSDSNALGIFVGFEPESALPNLDRIEAIAQWLSPDERLVETLRSLSNEWNPETPIHFAGRFFGRAADDAQGIRINLKGAWPVGASRWIPERIYSELKSSAATPSERTRAILALDITPSGIVRAGLESGPFERPAARADWMRWFGELPEALERQCATLAIPWNRSLMAEEGSPWPLAIIADGLHRDSYQFPLLSRAISHVKQSTRGKGELESKLYLSFGLDWPSARATNAALRSRSSTSKA